MHRFIELWQVINRVAVQGAFDTIDFVAIAIKRALHPFSELWGRILINGMCLFGVWRRKAPTVSSAKLDE